MAKTTGKQTLQDALKKKNTAAPKSFMKEVADNSDGAVKSKMISARVNPNTYKEFTKINKRRGTTNNSVLNTFIADYVMQYRDYLKEA